MRMSKKQIGLLTAAGVPILLLLLFFLLRRRPGAVDSWVKYILTPLAQALGRLWSVVPFSVGELITVCFLLWGLLHLVFTVVQGVRRRSWKPVMWRLAALLTVVLWIGALLCWMWQAVYYAPTFTEQSGMEVASYSMEELAQVTEYFARKAAEYSLLMERDESGSFVGDRTEYMATAVEIYQSLEEEFPFLVMEAVRAKPIFFSRFQSKLGFTGMYFPFTGEANVNVDFPISLFPATIAHEMAHQRMVASEMEANFIAIAACTSGGDEVFLYSGYLLGLIQLCNALYPEAPQRWYGIVEEYFTPELSRDWNENSAYWAQLESKLEDAAEQVYDTYLKSNDQELGINSYGACVDLLVAYYGPRILGKE